MNTNKSLDTAKYCDACGKWYTHLLLDCPACELTERDYDTFVAYLADDDCGHLEAVEELDILAVNKASATRMAKWVVSEECGEYIPGLKVLAVEGPQFGLYL